MKHWLLVVMDNDGCESTRGEFLLRDCEDDTEWMFSMFDRYDEMGFRPFLFSLVEGGRFDGYWVPCLTSGGPWPVLEGAVA